MNTPLPKKPNSPKKHGKRLSKIPKTLYEDSSGWGITEYEGYKQAAMTHKCKNSDGAMTSNITTNKPNVTVVHLTGSLSGKHRCSYCRKEAPDHIIALWTLYNWDNI